MKMIAISVWLGLGAVPAWAQEAGVGAPPSEPSFLASLFPLILIFAIFYFLLIRPQSVQMKKHREMTEKLGRGDKVITGGGIHGKVVKAPENSDTIEVEISEGVNVTVLRSTVSELVTAKTDSKQPANDSKASKKKAS